MLNGNVLAIISLLLFADVVWPNISHHISTVISKVSKSSISSGDGSVR